MEQSIGIIGGADGPTAVFVATETAKSFGIAAAVIIVVCVIIGIILYNKNKKAD